MVHIHGGPWARPDAWGRASSGVTEARLLASRGYAVILPMFRGTTGLGRKIFAGAQGEFGRRMQEDIEDVTDWAVREGIADARRICLSGASYGGYAALMGLVKTPDKYRCAVAGMPVSDIGLLIASGWSNISEHDLPRQFWIEMVGDPEKQAAALREVSPAHQAQRVRGAVMLYGGNEDWQTPVEQMEAMRTALRKHGQEPVWMLSTGEGHGLAGTQNRLALYARMFAFFGQHLAPLTPPASALPEKPAAP